MPGWATNNPSDYFALGKQSAKGTEASTFIFLRHKDGTGLDGDEDVTSEREGGDGQEVGLRYKNLVKMDGAVNANARPQVALYLLGGVLGKTATVIGADGAGIPSTCVKIRMVPNATLPYFTAEQRFADEIERVSDGKVVSVEISGEAGKAAVLSANFIGGGTPYRRDAAASSLTPTREVGDPVFFPRGSYVLNGAGNTKITKFKASLKRNVDDGVQTTELFRDDVIELTADYDLDFTIKYEDKTLYDLIRYAGGSMVPLTLTTGAFNAYMTNAAAGTLLRGVGVSFPLIQFAGAKVNKLDPDGKTVYLDVSAMTIKGATDSVIADVVIATQAALV